MRVLEPDARVVAREAGRVHGEHFRPLIRELAALRTELAIMNGAFATAAEVLEVARRHLPILERFDRALYEELLGIAEGAALEPAEMVVLNHYTDLKDLDPKGSSVVDAPFPEEDCSAVYARTSAGVLLGQTWDMHGSALPYVMMVGVPARDGVPAAWLLSITGCLGMAGMNEAGVAITINNLRSTDARVGVVWPALVRRALRETTAEAARDVILAAPLGSGHHYMVASREAVFGIETSGIHRKIVFDGRSDAFIHTNHCVDDEVAACTTIGPESTTRVRHDWMTASLRAAPVKGRPDLWHRLGSHDGYPSGICTHLASLARPHAMRTCGAIVADLTHGDMWATEGCVHAARPERFGFDSQGVGS